MTEAAVANWNMAKAAWVVRTAGMGEEAAEAANWEIEPSAR